MGRLDHVGYMVADLERATRWLVDVVGATPVGPVVSIPGTEIRVGAVVLGDFEWEIVEHPDIAKTSDPLAADALGTYRLVLGTSDLARVDAHLSARGVGYEQVERSRRFHDAGGFPHDAVEKPATGTRRAVPGVFDGGVRSVEVNVRSLSLSLDWYERFLGLRAGPDHCRDSAALETGGAALRLRETAATAAMSAPLTGMGPVHGAIEVDDVAATGKRLENAGSPILIPLRRDDHDGSRRFGRSSLFVADPDGLPVQVIGPRT